MKKKYLIYLLFFALFACSKQNKLKLVICGDSSLVQYDAHSKIHGWAQYIKQMAKPQLDVVIVAHGGETTQSFVKNGYYKKAIKLNPNWVFIQFGHNDKSHKISLSQYKQNFINFVDDFKNLKTKVALVTPQQWISYDANGKTMPILNDFANKLYEVSTEKNIPCLDLFNYTNTLFKNSLVSENNKFLYDNVHFTPYGAYQSALFIKSEIIKKIPELGKYFYENNN